MEKTVKALALKGKRKKENKKLASNKLTGRPPATLEKENLQRSEYIKKNIGGCLTTNPEPLEGALLGGKVRKIFPQHRTKDCYRGEQAPPSSG